MEADEESRKTELRTEWKLNRTISYNMFEYFQYYLEIDLFASRFVNLSLFLQASINWNSQTT